MTLARFAFTFSALQEHMNRVVFFFQICMFHLFYTQGARLCFPDIFVILMHIERNSPTLRWHKHPFAMTFANCLSHSNPARNHRFFNKIPSFWPFFDVVDVSHKSGHSDLNQPISVKQLAQVAVALPANAVCLRLSFITSLN